MIPQALPDGFFVAGGTVPPGSPSYVERSADRELFEALASGEYCYVLNSRQMGKSSLAVRAVTRLKQAGIRTAFIDLTRIGGPNVTAQQWFAGLLAETGRVLGLRQEAVAFLREQKELGPAQRFLAFLHESVLTVADSPLVVMIDEIDAVRSLGFSTDELFAGIRHLYNSRASEPALTRLTFCLLGAALPGDLMRDPRTTPFNVGRRIELRDFTTEEAEPFARALGAEGRERLERVLYWTGGHPFLTQALCAGLASDHSRSVDALVRERYLDERAHETDSNLADVGNRIVGRGDPSVSEAEVADTLSALQSMMLGRSLADDESNPSAGRIKMSGVSRLDGGRLAVRNRLYRNVFGRKWIARNMPGQELKRQRKAFWKGAARATAVSAVVTAVVGTLSWRYSQLAGTMERQRNQARYESYIASMQTMEQKFREGNFSAIERTLNDLKDSASRGWEWEFWNRVVSQGGATLVGPRTMVTNAAAAPTGRLVAVTDADSLEIYDIEAMKRTARIALGHSVGGPWYVVFFRDGKRVLVQDQIAQNLFVIDATTGKTVAKRRHQFINLGNVIELWWNSAKDGYTFVTLADEKNPNRHQVNRLNLQTLATSPVNASDSGLVWTTWFNRSGSRFACLTQDKNGSFISIRRTDDLAQIRRFRVFSRFVDLRFEPDDRSLIVCDGKSMARMEADSGKTIWSVPYLSSAGLIDLSPDGQRLLASTATRRANEYDVSGKGLVLIRQITNAAAPIFADGGRRILAFGDDWRVMDDEHRQTSSEVQVKGSPFESIQVTPDGRLVMMSAGRLWTLDGNSPLDAPVQSPAPGFGLLDSSGRFIFSAGDHGVTVTDSLGLRKPFTVPTPQLPYIAGCAADPNGKLIAFAKGPTEVGVFDTDTGSLVATLVGIGGPSCVKFSADGELLAAGDSEGVVTVWRTRDWQRISSGRLGRNYANSLAFSDDGERVACGLAYGDCGILDVRSGACLLLQGHSEGVNTLAWSHNGKRLATGSDDKTVRLWDTATGKEIGIVAEQAQGVMAVWFTKGDRTLCSLALNGDLKLLQTSDTL